MGIAFNNGETGGEGGGGIRWRGKEKPGDPMEKDVWGNGSTEDRCTMFPDVRSEG